MKNKRILITGATGFIGSHLVRTLLQEGYQNVLAMRRSTSKVTDNKQVEWMTGDLLDLVSLEEIIKGIDVVVHCAALISYKSADREKLIAVNAEGTANLVNTALDYGVERFIHVSSTAAFTKLTDRQVIDETLPWEDSDHNTGYGISKHLAETEVWRAAAEGLEMAIVNPAIVLGKGSAADIFFEYVLEERKFYPRGGAGFVDVQDVCRFIERLLNSSICNERFILSAGFLTYKELFIKIADQLNVSAPTLPLPGWAAELALIKEHLKTFFLGAPRQLSREAIDLTNKSYLFVNEKSLQAFPDFSYTPLEKSISEVAAQFRDPGTSKSVEQPQPEQRIF